MTLDNGLGRMHCDHDFFKILSWSMPQQTMENHIQTSFKLHHKNKRKVFHNVIFGIISALLMI